MPIPLAKPIKIQKSGIFSYLTGSSDPWYKFQKSGNITSVHVVF